MYVILVTVSLIATGHGGHYTVPHQTFETRDDCVEFIQNNRDQAQQVADWYFKGPTKVSLVCKIKRPGA